MNIYLSFNLLRGPKQEIAKQGLLGLVGLKDVQPEPVFIQYCAYATNRRFTEGVLQINGATADMLRLPANPCQRKKGDTLEFIQKDIDTFLFKTLKLPFDEKLEVFIDGGDGLSYWIFETYFYCLFTNKLASVKVTDISSMLTLFRSVDVPVENAWLMPSENCLIKAEGICEMHARITDHGKETILWAHHGEARIKLDEHLYLQKLAEEEARIAEEKTPRPGFTPQEAKEFINNLRMELQAPESISEAKIKQVREKYKHLLEPQNKNAYMAQLAQYPLTPADCFKADGIDTEKPAKKAKKTCAKKEEKPCVSKTADSSRKRRGPKKKSE
jgi:hypothetical protein